jgi:hypothetical protein
MIRITITQRTTRTEFVKKNLLVKSTPTDKFKVTKRTAYGDAEVTQPEAACEYEIAEVPERRDSEVELLRQEIADDAKFDLNAVICAINLLDRAGETPEFHIAEGHLVRCFVSNCPVKHWIEA